MGAVTALSRRAFVGGLAGLGASAAGLALVNGCGSLPLAAQPRVARVALLWTGSQLNANLPAAWRDGLRDAGWVEGQNLVFDERTYGAHPERIPDLAAELVALQPDVLLAGATDTAQALIRATGSIPIVFAALTDPVSSGIVASYARPGGNATGTSKTAGGSLAPKLLELLRQVVPGLARVAVVFELANASEVNDWDAIQVTASSVGIEAQAVAIASADDLERALETALAGHPQALVTTVDTGRIIPATNQPAITAITDFALQHGLPSALRLSNANGGSAGLRACASPALPPRGKSPRRSHPAWSKAR
jgi:putative tryptophan/tyrosine transport system substrate-binding protein